MAETAQPTAAWTPPETDKVVGQSAVEPTDKGWTPPETDAPTTTMEKVGVAAQGANVGIIRTGSVMATGIAGFKAGTMAAPFLGPLAPAAPVIGTIGGMALGYLGGEEAIDVLAPSGITYSDLSDVPDEQRPYAVFGEAAGSALTPGGAIQTAARMGTRLDDMTKTGWMLNRFIQSAQTAPRQFAATEVGLASGAGTGGAIAESYFPGDPSARMMGEVTGGFVNPTRVVTGGYNITKNATLKVLQQFSQNAQETAAGKILREVITETGGDPRTVARLLRETTITGQELPLTSAQLTGSQALAAVEKKLVEHSAKFGAEVESNMNTSLDSLRTMIIHMGQSGNPADLQVAAQLRTAYVKTLLDARISMAQEQASTAVSKITADTPGARLEISKQARQALDDAIADVRAVEKEMWGAVDGTATGEISNLAGMWQKIKADTLPEFRDKLPSEVNAFIKRITGSEENAGMASVAELRQLRTELLNRARMAMEGAQPDRDSARIYGRLAESVLDDLDAAFTGDTAYDQARLFSRELNDAFTRTFAGKATARGAYGDRIPPEILMRRATAGNAESRAIQLQELEEATRFLSLRGLDDSQESLNAMMDAQERMIRLAAADSIDPVTNAVNPKMLQKFINDNEVLLNRFPGLKDQLQDAVTSDVAAKRLTKMNSGRIDRVENQTFYGTLAKNDPISITKRALTSDTQEKDFASLINVALKAKDSKKAVDGLKSSVYESAIRIATNRQNGVLDITKFRVLLTKPAVAGGKSPIQMMQEAGVITKQEVDSLNKIFKVAQNIEKSTKPGTAVEVREGTTDMIYKAIARMVGSRATSAVAKQTGGNYGGRSIIVAQTGARMGDEILRKLPMQKVQDVLIEAMRNPEFAAKLLEKTDNPAMELRRIQQIQGYLMSSGINNLPTVVSPDDPANEDLMPQDDLI